MSQSAETLNRFAIGVVVQDPGNQLLNLENSLKRIGALQAKTVAGGSSKKGSTAARNATAASIKNTRALGREFKNAQVQVNAFNKQFRTAASSSKNDITDMLRRVTLWSSGIGLLFGTISKIRQVFQATTQLEMSMVELQKVMAVDTPFRKARENIFKTAKEYSVAVDKTAQVATVWAQQGKTYQEVAALTRAALMGVNSANLEAAQSVEFLTSITKSYNIEAERTVGVMDGIMRVQSHFAVTAASLAKGFMVVGKTAAMMGDDIGTVLGMITAISQVTREKGNVVGTSLKTQMARANKQDNLTYLENRYGIKTIDVGTKHRVNYRGIMQQISDPSRNFSKEAKIDIAQTLGGIRKYKDVMALMDQWDSAEKARMEMLFAYDDAAKANTLVQDTVIKKIEKLGIVFTDFGSNVLEQSFVPVLKKSIDVVSVFVEGLAKLSKTGTGKTMLGALPATGIALGAGMLMRTLGRNLMYESVADFGMRQAEVGSPIPRTGQFTATDRAMGLHTTEAQAYAKRNKLNAMDKNRLALERKTAAKQGENAMLRWNMANTQSALLASQNSGIKGLASKSKGWRTITLARRGFSAGFMENAPFSGVMKNEAGLALKTVAATKAMGGFAMSVLKTGAFMLALNLAIAGGIKLFKFLIDKYNSDVYKMPEIDVNSEASKAFYDLSKGLKSTKEAAKSAGVEIDDYYKTLTFSQKEKSVLKGSGGLVDIANRIDKKDADGKPAKDSIKYIFELQDAFQKMGFEAKNYSDTMQILATTYKFLDNEVLKSSKKLEESIRKQKEEMVNSLDDDVSSINFVNKLNKKVKKGQSATEDFLTNAKERFDTSGYTLATALVDGFIKKTKEVDKQGPKMTAVNKAVASATTHNVNGINIDAKKLLSKFQSLDPERMQQVMDEDWARRFEKMNPKARHEAGLALSPDTAPFSQTDIKEAYIARFEPAMNKWIDSIYDNVKGYKEWKTIAGKLKHNFKSKFESFGAALDGIVAGLKDMHDPIYEASLGLRKSISDISKTSSSRYITGSGFNAESENLKAFREFAGKLHTISSSMDEKALTLKSKIAHFERSNREGINWKKMLGLLGNAKNKGIPSNDYQGLTKFIKSQYKDTIEERQLGAVKEYMKLVGELEKTTNLQKIIAGDMHAGVDNYKKVFEDISKSTGLVFSEKQQNGIEGLLKKGGVSALENALKGFIDKLVKINVGMKKLDLAAGLQDSINSARTKITSMFSTGNRDVDRLAAHRTELKNIEEKYKTLTKVQKAYMSELKKGSTEEYETAIAELDEKKKNEIATENLSYSLEKMNSKLEDAKQITQMFTSATADFLSTTENFRFDNSKYSESGVRNYFKEIGKGVLQTRMTGALEALKANNKDNMFGQFILGTNIKKPEEKLEIATISNTSKMGLLTSSINTLNQTLRSYLSGGASAIKQATKPIASVTDIAKPEQSTVSAVKNIRKSVDRNITPLPLKRVPDQGLANFQENYYGWGSSTAGVAAIATTLAIANKKKEKVNPVKVVVKTNTPEKHKQAIVKDSIQPNIKTTIKPPDQKYPIGIRQPILQPSPPMSEYAPTIGMFDRSTPATMSSISSFAIPPATPPIKEKSWFDKLFANRKPLTEGQQLGLSGTSIASSIVSNLLAKNMGTTGDMVGAGQAVGGMLGMFGGPAGAMAGTFIGGLVGAALSSDEDKADSDNLKRIAENTATLKDLDSRLINAPSDFKLPALAKTGGNVQYTGGIVINVSGASDPTETASAVADALNQGVSNYNSVSGI